MINNTTTRNYNTEWNKNLRWLRLCIYIHLLPFYEEGSHDGYIYLNQNSTKFTLKIAGTTYFNCPFIVEINQRCFNYIFSVEPEIVSLKKLHSSARNHQKPTPSDHARNLRGNSSLAHCLRNIGVGHGKNKVRNIIIRILYLIKRAFLEKNLLKSQMN